MIAYISFEFVLELHDHLIGQYGGAKGLLNEGLLRSALEMPKARFNGRDLHRTVIDKGAAYLYHLIQNHPFLDGNKRTASMATLVFLTSNAKGSLNFHENDYQELILKVAQGMSTKKEIAKFFRRGITPHRSRKT